MKLFWCYGGDVEQSNERFSLLIDRRRSAEFQPEARAGVYQFHFPGVQIRGLDKRPPSIHLDGAHKVKRRR